MRKFSICYAGFKRLPLAALMLLMTAVASQPGCFAQATDDADAVLPPAIFYNPIPREQLAFLSGYAGRPGKDALRDKRINPLLKQVIPRTEFHYGRDMPLTEASDTVLDEKPAPVEVREGRYVLIGTYGGQYLEGRGFLWFDLQDGIGLGGVYFHPVNGEPTPTLAIFSRQLSQKTLSMSQLPAEFEHDLQDWAAKAGVPTVTTRYFIPENGKKYVLVHDEDYCYAPPSEPAPTQKTCQQWNAYAADVDLNAAWFMQAEHNAANAMVWGINREFSAWLDVRNQTCGIGPGALGCRIRMTRRRTRVLVTAP